MKRPRDAWIQSVTTEIAEKMTYRAKQSRVRRQYKDLKGEIRTYTTNQGVLPSDIVSY